MRRSNLTTLLYLVLVFASGMVLGGFANRLYMMKTVSAAPSTKTRAEFHEKYIQEMRTKLQLTDPQVAELKQIIEATDHSLREMHRSIDAEHAQKVAAMLNDSQKAEYAKIREERERKRREHEQKGQ
jgi:Spy/CpxP family protein refolding chaperone